MTQSLFDTIMSQDVVSVETFSNKTKYLNIAVYLFG